MENVPFHRVHRNGFRPTSKKPQPAAATYEPAGEKTTGVVKFFNGGFGFIVPRGGGEDVHFDQETLRTANITKIKKDQAVRYQPLRRLDGRYAGKICAGKMELLMN